MKTQISRKTGFTLVEIMIVVAIIGLLAAIAIPNFIKARTTSQKNACINNLRVIDGAKQQWALENNKSATALPVSSNLAKYCGRTSTATTLAGAGVKCPGNGSYTINAVNVKPQCSLSATLSHALP